MNFSKIHYRSFLGKLVRLPLRLIPKKLVLPIMQGRLRGEKWIVGSGEHGYWLGSYEFNKRRAFEAEVEPNSVIYDIGANVGFFSLLASELTGESGHVYAFEPLPRNIGFLRKHIAINKRVNIDVIEAAVSDRSGQAYFNLGASTAMGHLAESGEIQVEMVTLDELLFEGKITPPDTIKLDVEGAEFEALSGAQKLLEKFHPTLFIDIHNHEARQKVIKLLKELGYGFQSLDGKILEETKEVLATHLSTAIM